MIRILQLSDLHIVNDADGNNLAALLLQTAKDKFAPLQCGEKLLVLTGDFHFFKENNYKKTFDFIKVLANEMGIVLEQDVFIIPGNHDVSLAETMREQKVQSSVIKNVKDNTTLLQDDDYVDLLIDRFQKYSAFCRDLGIYSASDSPASVHVRTWQNKLNFIHLNTCLVADSGEKQNQLLDTKKATSISIENELPCIALGHNSFFDLHSEIQTSISAPFYRLGVKAYLCGDRHKLEKDRYQQDIKLVSGYGDKRMIPNIVCCRSSADVTDDYSDVGCIIHEWDTTSGNVSLEFLVWDSKNDQSKFDVTREEDVYNLNNSLEVSNPSVSQSLKDSQAFDSAVLNNYQKYIRLRCSEIDINGLPTQTEDIARKYELSKLFVPPRLCLYQFVNTPVLTIEDEPLHSVLDDEDKTRFRRESVDIELSDFISKEGRVVLQDEDEARFRRVSADVELSDFIPKEGVFHYLVLAAPGAGKSTLLKRIASSYCFPDEYLSDANLTVRELFPIWIRCRDIKDQSYSIWDAINNIPKLGEWAPELIASDSFLELVKHHIERGTALLLVDGLDEIGSDRGRSSFVEHLHSFIASNPSVNLIITSREKGFSVISNKHFLNFSSYRISDLCDEDINELCNKWFALVYGQNDDVRKDCKKLISKIISNDRLKRLAKNPLMLTTLLLVDRRTGSLPTKRAGLYYEATKVLLETWNSEYHEREVIDLDEAKNQLAYVAFQMTANYANYKNRITKTELVNLLRDVREECSNLVSGNVGTIDTVISVIERRSALLIQAGTEKKPDGHLESIYEFQHTTFQEYLAAYAVSIGCFPGARNNKTKGAVLDRYILTSNMKEVILLSVAMDPAVATYLVKTIQVRLSDTKTKTEREKLCELLIHFIADEAALSKEEIRSILETCRDEGIPNTFIPMFRQIVQGKYKQNLQDFFKASDIELHDGYDYYSSLVELLTGEILTPYDYYLSNFNSEDVKQKVKAISVLTNSLFINAASLEKEKKEIIKQEIITATRDKNKHIARSAFDFIRFAAFIESNAELSYYLDSLSYYINTFHKIPSVISINESKCVDNLMISVTTPLSLESIELILEYIDSDKVLSDIDYRERLFLVVCVTLSCDDTITATRIFDSLDKITPDLSSKSINYYGKDYSTMIDIVQACPTVSEVAKNALMRFVTDYKIKVERDKEARKKRLIDLMNSTSQSSETL